jgi:hypothetical protein
MEESTFLAIYKIFKKQTKQYKDIHTQQPEMRNSIKIIKQTRLCLQLFHSYYFIFMKNKTFPSCKEALGCASSSLHLFFLLFAIFNLIQLAFSEQV